MNTDNFVWNDELVKEYAAHLIVGKSCGITNADEHLRQFKQSKQPPISKEGNRIEVLGFYLSSPPHKENVYVLNLSEMLNEYKFPAIKQAIERVLNEDTVVEGSKTWEFCSECKNKRLCSFRGRCEKSSAEVDELKNNILYLEQTLEANQDKVYSKKEVDAMMEKAFDAARERDFTKHPVGEYYEISNGKPDISKCYPYKFTFKEYLQSLSENKSSTDKPVLFTTEGLDFLLHFMLDAGLFKNHSDKSIIEAWNFRKQKFNLCPKP